MDRGRVIGLVSGKGGVGKTSLTINLGVALKKLNREVTVVDTDFSASNIGVHLGRYDHPVKVQDVLSGEKHPEAAHFRHPTGINAMVSSNELHKVSPDPSGIQEVVDHAARKSDFVLVDCPPGLDDTVEAVMEACDELLVVTMPTQSSGINAAQVVEKAKELEKPVLGTVINMSESNPERELVEREVEMMTESHILGEIPQDDYMKASIFENEPLVHYEPLSDAAIEIRRLAHDLNGSDFEEPSFPKFKRGFRSLKENLKS